MAGDWPPEHCLEVVRSPTVAALLGRGPGGIVKFWAERPSEMPWYDRARGYLFLAAVKQKYDALEFDLRRRIEIQRIRIREAADYAKLLEPAS